MTLTLIENSKKEATKIDFLTSEEREEITNIIEQIRYESIYYDKYKEETEWTGKYDDVKLAGFFAFLEYNQQVIRIKEIFTNIKKRVGEQKEVELLEQNVLGIMEKLTEGVDYWENIDKDLSLLEWIEANEWLKKELKEAWSEGETHIEVMHDISEMAKEQNDKETKKLREENKIKSELLQESDEKLKKLKVENLKLKEEGEIKSQMLREASEREIKKNQKIKELETQLSFLNNKPLSKNPNKFKIFKRVKTKLQNLAEKTKQQSQKLFARVEVRVK